MTSCLYRVFALNTTVTISWTGSLFNARDLMLQPFKQHVTAAWPGAQPLAPEGTALEGAELLASLDASPMFTSLVHIFER